ncbi:MAG: glycosyltransferase family 2 protein [Candidatus Curtissbacteria bacterium]
MNLSALILAKNEQEMIGDCLSQLDFVDEIIVLDQGSSDNTVEIAKKYTQKILKTKNDSFAHNRETLSSHAKGEWLLYIDADERLGEELKREIEEGIKQNKYQAFYFPRKNIILGKWLRHGGWSPDYVPKLFNKESLKGWYGQVHESPQVDGQFGYFKQPLTHLTARSLTAMLDKTIKWAKVEADLALKANHPKVTAPKIIWSAQREFFQRYFIKRGALDGFVGLVEAIYQALHKAITLVYLWEMQTKTHEKFLKEVKKHD